MKTCSCCKMLKPVEDFGRNKARPDGTHYYCKQCANQKAKDWRNAHPDRWREISTSRYRRQREQDGRKPRSCKMITCPVCGFTYRWWIRPRECVECGTALRRSVGRPRLYTNEEWAERKRQIDCQARKKFRERNPDRYDCEKEVARGKRNGTIVPQPCEVCGAEPTEGHHDDYDRPLNVRWLCRKHHLAHHKALRA